MWPFSTRARTVALAPRQTESVASDRRDWLSDKGTVGPQGPSQRGLPDAKRALAVRKSRLEYEKAAVYGGVLDRLIDFVLGDGIVIKARDEVVDKWLQAQLKRGWYGQERKHVENLFIDGENLLVVRAPARGATGAPVGEVRIGACDPLEIGDDLIVNVFDAADVVEVKVRPANSKLQPFTLPVIRSEATAQPVLIEKPAGEQSHPEYVLGAFWRANARGARGVPVLLRTLDHASDLDNLVGNLVAQLEYARRLWLVAWLNMPDDSDLGKDSKFLAVKQRLTNWAASLETGEIAVFSGRKEDALIESFAPKLEMADAKALYDVVLEMCLGGHGIPKMWFGNGGDTNRATAAEQGTPIFRAIQSRQADVKANVEALVRALLTMGEASRVANVTTAAEFDVTMATVATRDSDRDVKEISGLQLVLNDAEAAGVITADERRRVLRQILKSKTFGDQLDEDDKAKSDAAATPAPALPAGTPAAAPAAGAPPLDSGKVSDAAFNGAQVTALKDIMRGVEFDGGDPEVAALMLEVSFPTIKSDMAKRMTDRAAVVFRSRPKPTEPVAPAVTAPVA